MIVVQTCALPFFFFFFFKQKTAYEIYQCDWSSDVCSSDLDVAPRARWPLDPNAAPAPGAGVKA